MLNSQMLYILGQNHHQQQINISHAQIFHILKS